jgi:hypothetical protein
VKDELEESYCVSSTLGAIDLVLNTAFQEHVWCLIANKQGISQLIRVCYHMPTESVYGPYMHGGFRDLLNEVGNRHML